MSVQDLGLQKIRRALISVSDKQGIISFARVLASREVELVSTGGTGEALAAAGLLVREVAEITGFPEMMDGRLKTLHPKVHGGLLAIRNNMDHEKAMAEHGIAPIDLLVVNLYPFRQAVARPGVTIETAVENIDIGGPAMIRAAAKNHAGVAVVTSPEQYTQVLTMLNAHDGALPLSYRKELMARAFIETASYEKAIAVFFATRYLHT